MKRIALSLLLICAACVENSPSDLSRATLDCEFGRPSVLPVGGVLRDASGSAQFCVQAPEGGAFALVPFIGGVRDTSARVTVSVFGGGFAPELEPLDAERPRSSLTPPFDLARVLQSNDAWHDALRLREEAELKRLFRPGLVAPQPATARTPVAHVPVPGEMMQFNVAVDCDRIDRRSARVVAVTNQAIVAYDPANPTERPFTDEELRTFGREFDELIYPT